MNVSCIRIACVLTFFLGAGCGSEGPPKASNFGGGFRTDAASVCDPNIESCSPDANTADVISADAVLSGDGGGEDASQGGVADVQAPGDGGIAQDAIAADTPSGEDAGQADTGEPVEETGGIGSPCDVDADCTDEGAVCVEWPEGSSFCTVIECDQGIACPLGSVCIDLSPGTWGCAPTCEKSGDCPPGYPCKTLMQASGSLVSVCHATTNKAGGSAQLCEHPMDCKDKYTCITDWPGGYCAVLGCSPGKPCPSGTSCVETEDMGFACLKQCDATKPCPGEIPKFQNCGPAITLSGEEEDVCLIGETGKDLGEFCTEDDECLSKDCKLTSIGACASDGTPCMDEGDCSEGSSCDPDPLYVAGVCVQGCSAEVPCPEGTHCIPLSSSEGECRKACQSLADNFTCDPLNGETLEYGIPLDGQMDTGVYACVTVLPGQTGDGCIGDLGLGCANGLYCYPGNGATGMCISACGSFTPGGVFYCPWTTACASDGGSSQCMKLCPSGNVQCPDGFECKHIEFGVLIPFDICSPIP